MVLPTTEIIEPVRVGSYSFFDNRNNGERIEIQFLSNVGISLTLNSLSEIIGYYQFSVVYYKKTFTGYCILLLYQVEIYKR